MARDIQFDLAKIADRAAVENTAFGGPIPDNDYGDLIGDITDNAKIVVYFNAPRLDSTCPITIRAKTEGVFSSVVRIYTDPLHVEYSDCKVVNQGQGTGPQIFKLLADTAKRLGFPDIKAEGRRYVSAQNPHMNCFGHYVYAKLGFNASIPGDAPARPADIANHATLLDLTAVAPGRIWWKQNGVTVPNMVFDLADDSPSWHRLAAELIAAPQVAAPAVPPAAAPTSAPAAPNETMGL
jgi:hypothetical protein